MVILEFVIWLGLTVIAIITAIIVAFLLLLIIGIVIDSIANLFSGGFKK